MTILILIFGFLFGAILAYAYLNRYETIGGQARGTDWTVAKAILVAVGAGAILLNIVIATGAAGYHIKPFITGGLLLGGILFGIGMAILGYCPGTMAVSLGEGRLDALAGIAGGLAGSWLFAVSLPSFKGILGPDLGKISLHSAISNNVFFFVVLIVVSALFIALAFWLEKKYPAKNKRWLWAGIALAVLDVVVFLKPLTNRPIGASTTYPYAAGKIAGLTDNAYCLKIDTPGHWELIFLAGAFLAGLVIALARKDFKITSISPSWEKYYGSSQAKRLLWAFIGGFVMLFGARMAGGCTSGHVISGGMQMAFSSLFFGVVLFISLLITGKLFYRK